MLFPFLYFVIRFYVSRGNKNGERLRIGILPIIYLEVGVTESNKKVEKEYRKPWFLILIVIFIFTIVFEGSAKPMVPGSFPWLLIISVFLASLAIGVYIGLKSAPHHETRK